MFRRSETSEAKRLFLNVLFGCAIFGYSVYWMYICASEHWLRAIGSQNLVLLLFHAVLVFSALFFLTKEKIKPYQILALFSLVPGLIVCFINRAARHIDMDNLIGTFNAGRPDDPVTQGFAAIYNEGFLRYDYIISRSSTSSIAMFALQFIWMVIVLFV
jgi:hypothetical protein